jgi:hypothetical protein
MHSQKLVHGALWPENLWLDPAGTLKILQFPLVMHAAGVRNSDPAAADYLAPELIDPELAPNELTDIYGLGCTLYELIAGRVPFPGGTAQQKMRRHQAEIPQRIDQLATGVAEEVADLVAEMLEKDPLLRCQSASHIAHLLAPFASGLDPPAARPPENEARKLTPGYGAWKAPPWKAPPRQSQTAPGQVPSSKQAEPKPTPPPDARAGQEQALVRASGHQHIVGKQRRPIAAFADHATELFSGQEELHDAKSAALADPVGALAATDAREAPMMVTARNAASIRPPAKRRFSNMAIVGGACLALAIVLVVALILFSGDEVGVNESTTPAASEESGEGQTPQQRTRPQAISDAPAQSRPGEVIAPEPGIALVDDDGQTLWTSPTAGNPIILNYLPSGAQAFLILRPAELLKNAEGARLLDALGPAGQWSIARLRSILGVELANIEQLSIAFYPNDAGALRVAFAMRLVHSVPRAALVAAWNEPLPAERNSKAYFVGSGWAYWLPEGADGRAIAIANVEAIEDILDLDGMPLVAKGIERLLHGSDAARHCNLLLAPSYLFNDGKELLAGDREKLRDPLLRFLDERVEAVLLSAHLGSELFLELRVLGPADQPPRELAALLHARLKSAADGVESYVVSLDPREYGRAVIDRFPQMMHLLNDFTRAGVEDRQAVLRCYLPLAAAHNMLLATELVLSEPAAGGQRAEEKARPRAKSADIAAALEKRISLSFSHDTLENCLQMLAKEIGADVVILGADLQLEGVTKNQSLALDERNQPAREILLKVLKLANPDGKLIYLIKPHEEQGEVIFITTRSAASKRGDRPGGQAVPKSPKEST